MPSAQAVPAVFSEQAVPAVNSVHAASVVSTVPNGHFDQGFLHSYVVLSPDKIYNGHNFVDGYFAKSGHFCLFFDHF